MALKNTALHRPDLLENLDLSSQDQEIVETVLHSKTK